MISILCNLESGPDIKNRSKRGPRTPSREITRTNAMIIWLSAVALIVLGFITTFYINAIAGFALFLIGMGVGAYNSLAFKIKGPETNTIEVDKTDKSAQDHNNRPEPIPVYPKSKTTVAVCPNCKSDIPNSVSFCPFCGRNLQVKEDAPTQTACSNCRMPIPADAKFCPFCATEVHKT